MTVTTLTCAANTALVPGSPAAALLLGIWRSTESEPYTADHVIGDPDAIAAALTHLRHRVNARIEITGSDLDLIERALGPELIADSQFPIIADALRESDAVMSAYRAKYPDSDLGVRPSNYHFTANRRHREPPVTVCAFVFTTGVFFDQSGLNPADIPLDVILAGAVSD